MLWAGERAALRSWAFRVLMLMEEPYSKENRKGLSEGVMGNLSLYLAREPPSTSLATVLAQKDRSLTFGSFVLHSLAILPAGSAATDGAYYHLETSEA
jgi:hypothetical protein